jgi:hypothetical protein
MRSFSPYAERIKDSEIFDLSWLHESMKSVAISEGNRVQAKQQKQ